jgi:hypothetical protein
MITMNIACPLCGRHVPEEVFDPSNFEEDIYAVEVSGLGRARGFTITGTYSIQDPLILGLIKDRCHQILHMIDNKEYLPPQEISALRALLDQWINYARNLEAENEALRDELEEDDYEDDEEYIDRLLERINKEADYEFESLEEAIDFLLEL